MNIDRFGSYGEGYSTLSLEECVWKSSEAAHAYRLLIKASH